jgi:undecaprenyl phosphate-alpha-L-ara4N flippase subunit ArnE
MPAYGALLISIVLTVVSQVLQKQAADTARGHGGGAAYLRLPRFWLALLCLGGALLSWLFVLTALEVSKAYALLSINYVLILLVSRFLFSETIPPSRWLGVLCILAGLLLIARS